MFEILTKRKIVIVLLSIIVITIITIFYYGFTFKFTERFMPDLKMIGKILENDNMNSNNQSKCWEKENFKVVEACDKCTKFYRKTLKACDKTGYREVIKCEKFGLVSRSCSIPTSIKRKHFWLFEFIILIVLSISTFIVLKRKDYLDRKATERVRQQLISS